MTESLDPAGLRRLRDAMAARVADGDLPGLVTLVARGDQVQVETIGRYAFDSSTPMRRDTLFRIASMTKPVLAVATMILVEEGMLSLAEPVDRLLPELADRRVLARIDGPLDETVPARRPITVEDLLTSRMGFGIITEPSFNPPYPIVRAADELRLSLAQPDPRTPHPPDEWLRRFGTLPLMSQPGERWHYNASFLVLGALLGRAVGGRLADVLRDRIFTPLGMTDTGFWTAASEVERIPAWYMTDYGTGELTRQTTSQPVAWAAPPAFDSGAGGLLSTVDDFLTFARMLLDGGTYPGGRLLTAESARAITTNHLTGEQMTGGGALLDGNGWGYGVGVVVHPDETSAVPGRYGWSGGYGTVWFNDPHRDLIGIAMTQTSDFLFTGGCPEFIRLAARAAD